MKYYSRKKGNDKELLEEHLRKTSVLCEQFMSKFGMPVTGRVIGRLHDIGKHTKKFQEVLFGNRVKVNHAIVSGQRLYSIFERAWEDILYIITSHHYGLHKGWNFNPDFNNPISLLDIENKENALSNKDELEDIKKWLTDIGFDITKEEAQEMYKEYKKMTIKTKNERMFINRMIFSCLVDADYSASISFENAKYLDEYDGEKLDPDTLIKKLEVYRNNLISKSTSNFELNKLRNDVFEACANVGKSNYGNYTLTAPTGTAKTLATLAFALENAKANNRERIIFVLPFLSIIEQNAQIYRDICGENIVLEDDSQTNFTEETKCLSDRWSAPIIVTTSVKFFETLFKREGSDLRKLHNISNSVVVFDESQTIPNDILDSSLEVLNVLNNKFAVTTLFSTATPPSFNYRKNINWVAREIIDNPQSLFDRYENIKKMETNWIIDKPIDNNELFELLENKDSYLVIFNLKKHANDFYKLVESQINELEKDTLFYISTNLCSSHRTDVLNVVKDRLKNGLKTKIISTQCLEAGVDLDLQYVFRAFGPATSIAQAAGRCSRNALYPGELTIFVPEGKRIYPDNNYKNMAIQLKSLISTSGGFNICSLNDIDNYYSRVFNTLGLDKDNQKLIEAIDKISYEEVEENYKLIKNKGLTVIVPYLGNYQLYTDIKEELIENDFCISKVLMKKAQFITVNSYNKKEIETFCIPLYFRINGEKHPCNWFLLDNGTSFYDNNLGLDFTADSDFLF